MLCKPYYLAHSFKLMPDIPCYELIIFYFTIYLLGCWVDALSSLLQKCCDGHLVHLYYLGTHVFL